MEIVNDFPPQWDFIQKYLPTGNNEVLITIGNIIYNPYKTAISGSQLAHEQVHSEQQKVFKNFEDYFEKYVNDREFRLHNEAEAYGMQMKIGGEGLPRSVRRNALDFFARALSSPLYGNCCNFDQAKELIKIYAGS